jgi:fermentation-respiration switch protein FrsA (DUF1100 family)
MKARIMLSIKIIFILITAYLCLAAFMYIFQRSFTFQPSHTDPFATDTRPFTPFVYQTPMGLNIRGLYVPAQQNKPTIIYMQGNAGNVADRLYKTKSFIERGYGFALVGYRGYSGNPGSPTETNFYEDARSAINAVHHGGVAYEDMILYGESIGTGVATQIATELPQAKALILEAPFTSTVDVAKRFYWFLPVNQMLKDRFENDRKIGALKMPILVIHGTKDNTVPDRLGKKLYSLVTSPVKEMVSLEGANHADVYDFGAAEKINAFLDRL